MDLVHSESLAETVNAVNDAFFLGRDLAPRDRERAALWIASRQGLPGSYAGSFALFDSEGRAGIRLFTGERATNAGARHIVGQEACRALRFLDVDHPTVQAALRAASENLAARVGPLAAPGGSVTWFDAYAGGVYCCGKCSVGFWRHLTAGGFDQQERRLAIGLRCLASRRRDDRSWGVFPFWYTVSALIEMPPELAQPELRYAAPRLERAAARRPPTDQFGLRRHAIAARALALV
jgi:hypothetical protein